MTRHFIMNDGQPLLDNTELFCLVFRSGESISRPELLHLARSRARHWHWSITGSEADIIKYQLQENGEQHGQN